MANLNTFLVDQLRDAVCLATKECLYLAPNQGTCRDDSIGFVCSECKGTSRIWALPGMQERCPASTGRWKDHDYYEAEDCPKCHGLGYVAKRDLGALLDTVRTSLSLNTAFQQTGFGQEAILYKHRLPIWHERAYGDTNEEALLRAVAQALVAQGATLGVTTNG